MSRQALGRGLRALIPEVVSGVGGGPEEGVREIRVAEVEANPFQPRRQFSEASLQELAESIRAHGVLEPIVVRPAGREGQGARYQIVIGERRWRAARMAGLEAVPAVVRAVDDRQMLQMALVENLQREDLSPLEEAEAYRRLVEEFGMSQEAVAQAVGRKRPTVANALRLLELEPEIQGWIEAGWLSAGHGKALLGLPAGPERVQVARKAAEGQLSVRETEELVRRMVEGREEKGGREQARKRDPGSSRWGEVAAALERALGTRVVIREGRRKGRIEIEFYGEEELVRLVELLGQVEARAEAGEGLGG
ncbi:ParB/RepB/Spo0J family partition protein [Carboxydochorda subterranea]|uniref:ParB/RepB/Spo0J family partition protein n=1 Tax=Carboxydichorda subterranea TaxID=3109565 RepID=A0ABZ1BWC8_9FIRM|nr:ParB/RepB/Spo0J family partition protein [Limnochorda sp. L945t]WRP17112.1 ParB/RepB/Spo0J family partition protein [Limnochorda sp. L945t]